MFLFQIDHFLLSSLCCFQVASLPKQQWRGKKPKFQDGIAGRPPNFNASGSREKPNLSTYSKGKVGDWKKEEVNNEIEEKRRAELDDLFAPEGDYSVAGEAIDFEGEKEGEGESKEKQWKGGWVQVFLHQNLKSHAFHHHYAHLYFVD